MKLSTALTSRKALIILHDLVMTAVAVMASFIIRFDVEGLQERTAELSLFLPPFVIYAGIVYHIFDLYRAKWRFASLPDLSNIVRAVVVLTLTLVVVDYIIASSTFYKGFFPQTFYRDFLFGKITIGLYFILQVVCLGGPRLIYRYYRYTRTRKHAKSADAVSVLLLGRASDADVFLRAVESGAIGKVWPIGILSEATSDRGQSVRGVPVLGTFTEFEAVMVDLGQGSDRPNRLVCLPSAFEAESALDALLSSARRMGLATSRLPSLDANRTLDGGEVRLAPLDVEDLMLRPRVDVDYKRLRTFAKGRSAIVTGGGGSIGSEICDRLVAFGIDRLLVLDNSEPGLHAVLEKLAMQGTGSQVEGRIADVRDRDRIMRLFTEFQPDLVFHAAALKHVPILERDWQEGVKTNVLGSIHVCDAAIAVKASALVMISTDKAIEPVSILGATKRFAEMYAQAHDRAISDASGDGARTRLIAVRFGNVLASSGSVVPKFKAQIAAGGPVTVTHPDMVRYFMTIREACDLVVTASSHALEAIVPPVSVYVLNMGQPVRILDVAERMIRLAGLEPGKDIEIVFTGMRPGERLHEVLFSDTEASRPVGIAGIVAARTASEPLPTMREWIAALEQAVARDDRAAAEAILGQAVPDYRRKSAA